MAAGFVHGVLNTDNINVTGESFDYGPWRFLPVLDPAFTAAYFDETGLYAYGAQPEALLWNLTRLAECLLPFASQAALEEALGRLSAGTAWRLRRGAAAPARAELGRRGPGRGPDPFHVGVHGQEPGAVRTDPVRLAWRPREPRAGDVRPVEALL